MEKFQRVQIVEARKYEGPRLTVVHDSLGEQTANPGDYLVGSERGQIKVVSAAKFEAEYVPCVEGAEDPEKAIAVLNSELAMAKGEAAQLDIDLAAEKDKTVELEAELASTKQLVGELEAKLNPPTAA
jgi:hypothetical protein